MGSALRGVRLEPGDACRGHGYSTTPPLHHSFPYTIGLEPRSRVWKPGLREWSESPGFVGIAEAGADVDEGAAGAVEGHLGKAGGAGGIDQLGRPDWLARTGKDLQEPLLALLPKGTPPETTGP